MIELNEEPGKSFLVCKSSGFIQRGEFAGRMPELKKLVAETRPKGLLLDWTELKGWDEETESLRFSARLEVRDNFERVAILADRAWDAEVSRFRDVMDFPVRRFPPSDRQTAMAWLESDIE